MKYICKKSSNQEMFVISLSSCSRYNANFKFDQSVFAIRDSLLYFWDQWVRPPTQHRWSPTPTIIDELHCFANAFVFPGVNSRAEYPRPGFTPGTTPLARGLRWKHISHSHLGRCFLNNALPSPARTKRLLRRLRSLLNYLLCWIIYKM
jgi:hypothetical protein